MENEKVNAGIVVAGRSVSTAADADSAQHAAAAAFASMESEKVAANGVTASEYVNIKSSRAAARSALNDFKCPSKPFLKKK
jgi:hypothetical protein